MLNAANAEMLNAANAGVNAGVLHSRCPDVRVRIRWCSTFGMPACPHLNVVAGCWYTAFVNAQSNPCSIRICCIRAFGLPQNSIRPVHLNAGAECQIAAFRHARKHCLLPVAACTFRAFRITPGQHPACAFECRGGMPDGHIPACLESPLAALEITACCLLQPLLLPCLAVKVPRLTGVSGLEAWIVETPCHRV